LSGRPKGIGGRPLHPFLFAAFPIFYLAKVNLWSITVAEMLPPLAWTLAVVAVLYIAARRSWADGRRAAVGLSMWTLLFFSYGHVWAEVDRKEVGGIVLAGDSILLVVWVFLALVALAVAIRLKAVDVATRLLNAMGIALVLTTAVPVTVHLATVQQASAMTAGLPEGLESGVDARDGPRPDVYYLVFDRYAGPETLRERFGYRNERFLSFLEHEGFVVPCSSFANYEDTTKSLAASLNLEYIDWIADRAGRDSRSQVPLYSAIRNNVVARFLKASGYRYVHVGSWWDTTNTSPLADVNYRLDAPSGFTRALYTSSALWPPARRGLVGSVRFGREELHRSVALRQLELLRDAASMRGPKFVFAHVLLPHPPYVFAADGSLQTHERRVELVNAGRSPYIEQLKYLNGRLERVVRELISSSRERPPIVIIQADEGPHLTDIGLRNELDPMNATDKQLRYKYKIMNALYLPGVDPETISDKISPVNAFRVVFNEYFGASLELLPDRAYISPDADLPFTSINITKRVRRPLEHAPTGACRLAQRVAPDRPAEKKHAL
jgi:hypothetical protein